MPRAESCLLGSAKTSVEKAIALRDDKQERKKPILDFRCVECRKPVRPHRGGKNMAAHFEHSERNPNCKLSDPLR